MKRLLDIVSIVLVVLAVAVGWKIVQVVRVEPPVFGDVPQLAALEPLPAAPQPETPRGAALDSIVEGNLFETERGANQPTDDATVDSDEPPLPPPTNVVLNGVFFQMGGRPMAIMTDTNSGNRQLTLQKGDNLGEYQVGDISRQRVVLLGRMGQEFSLELDVKKGGAAAAPGPAGRPVPGQPARPAQPARAAATPPARSPAAERVSQTAAQRAAEARRLQAARARQSASARRDQEQQEPQRPDATEARLEALRRLREAARTR